MLDAAVDVIDLFWLVDTFGTTTADSCYNVWADLNRDGSIVVVDPLTLVGSFGATDLGS